MSSWKSEYPSRVFLCHTPWYITSVSGEQLSWHSLKHLTKPFPAGYLSSRCFVQLHVQYSNIQQSETLVTRHFWLFRAPGTWMSETNSPSHCESQDPKRFASLSGCSWAYWYDHGNNQHKLAYEPIKLVKSALSSLEPHQVLSFLMSLQKIPPEKVPRHKRVPKMG